MDFAGKSVMVVSVALLVVSVGYIVIGRVSGPAPSGAPMRNVTMPDAAVLPPMAALGAPLFEAKCAGCHGAAGSGRDGFGPPLIHDMYRPDGTSDAAFEAAILHGAPMKRWEFGDMASVAGATPETAAQIIAYLRAVQVLNGVY